MYFRVFFLGLKNEEENTFFLVHHLIIRIAVVVSCVCQLTRLEHSNFVSINNVSTGLEITLILL